MMVEIKKYAYPLKYIQEMLCLKCTIQIKSIILFWMAGDILMQFSRLQFLLGSKFCDRTHFVCPIRVNSTSKRTWLNIFRERHFHNINLHILISHLICEKRLFFFQIRYFTWVRNLNSKMIPHYIWMLEGTQLK